MIKNLVAALAVLLCGCSSLKVRTNPQSFNDRVFPPGKYRHQIDLTAIIPPNSEKSFRFSGALRMDESEINVVALSYFGTTLFKIKENLKTGEVSTELYMEQMKPFEPKIRAYYSVLRLVFLAKTQSDSQLVVKARDSSGLPLELEGQVNAETFIFNLSGYDKNKIPNKLKIQSPRFRADVSVEGYEL